MVAFAVSTDTTAAQSATARRLGLDYSILSEAPTVSQHLVGSAYGVYHVSQGDAAPVDANAIVIIDAQGIVRAMRVEPDRAMTTSEILALANNVLGSLKSEKHEPLQLGASLKPLHSFPALKIYETHDSLGTGTHTQTESSPE